MRLLYKTVTGDAQLVPGECYLMGVELTHSTDDILILYDEPTSDKSAARKVTTLRTSGEQLDVSRKWPYPGVKCNGIYADWTGGVGTIYYYL
ncbi:MAG TPA: hypothetical protein ENI23_01530 [bacterium]|nr:hypothetical protein [bacterium]